MAEAFLIKNNLGADSETESPAPSPPPATQTIQPTVPSGIPQRPPSRPTPNQAARSRGNRGGASAAAGGRQVTYASQPPQTAVRPPSQQQQQQQQQQPPLPGTGASTAASPAASPVTSPAGKALSAQAPRPQAPVQPSHAISTAAPSPAPSLPPSLKRPPSSVSVNPSPLGGASLTAASVGPMAKRPRIAAPGAPAAAPAFAAPPVQRNAYGVVVTKKATTGTTYFLEELPAIMYGFGDDPTPNKETVEVVEELVVQYITTVVKKALETGSKRNVLTADSIRNLFKHDRKKFLRIKQLMSAIKELNDSKKNFDDEKNPSAKV